MVAEAPFFRNGPISRGLYVIRGNGPRFVPHSFAAGLSLAVAVWVEFLWRLPADEPTQRLGGADHRPGECESFGGRRALLKGHLLELPLHVGQKRRSRPASKGENPHPAYVGNHLFRTDYPQISAHLNERNASWMSARLS